MVELMIPKEWQPTKVSDIGTLVKGVNYKKHEARKIQESGLKPILRANNINGNLNFEDLVFVPENRIVSQQYIKKHDVIFCMSSGSKNLVGKSSQAEKDYDGSYGAFCSLFRPLSIVNSRFVGYFFQAPRYRKFISAISKGTNINNLKREHILGIDFCLPSLQEQEQIVSSLEELFSDLDNAIENLKKAQEQLKVYRQAVLKGALEGCFLKDGLGRKSWKELTVDEIGEVITGNTPSKKETKYYGKDYPLYKPGDLDAGFMTADSVDGLTEEGIKKARMLSAKSVLVTCIGATIGKTGLIRNAGACNQQINAIVPKDFMVSEYVYYYCISPQFQEQIKTNASATTLPILNKTKFQRLMFLVPARDVQEKIVEEIESRFSVCDKMEESIGENLQKSQALRQSILKQAFEGRLTEQWRKDHKDLISGENSAESLLKKIRAEKETLKIKSKGRNKG